MSHTVHGAKGLHKQAAIDHKAVEHFHEHVAVAAYFHAEHRGFNGGDPVADWLAAEAEINAELNKDKGTSAH
ncbi:hypothetical protein GALL_267010 [mine drainage metagenome]|uniref:DUF2934 domain-containing protein n=1 Tax=mine drainage metagenome TaxID=410659 RepID=A0A1J5RH92_9ZZZZ